MTFTHFLLARLFLQMIEHVRIRVPVLNETLWIKLSSFVYVMTPVDPMRSSLRSHKWDLVYTDATRKVFLCSCSIYTSSCGSSICTRSDFAFSIDTSLPDTVPFKKKDTFGLTSPTCCWQIIVSESIAYFQITSSSKPKTLIHTT